MKRKITKWMAGISSVAMLASFSALSVPAFAAEYEAMEAESYVASFANEKAQKVAKYLLDNGVSLEETEQMVDRYMNGLAMIESEQNANSGIAPTSTDLGIDYYNGINSSLYKAQLSKEYENEHQETLKFKQNEYHGVFLINKPRANVQADLKVSWKSVNGVPVIAVDANSECNVLNDYYNNTSFAFNMNKLGAAYSTETETKDTSNPLAIFEFPFTPSASLNSEAAIKNAITFKQSVDLLEDGNGIESTFDFHTYVLGDFDHDGVVCDMDYSYLIDFVMMLFDGKFKYTNVGEELAFEINTLAMDINEDGVINLLDGIAWNKLP